MNCPKCGRELVTRNGNLYCFNYNCEIKLVCPPSKETMLAKVLSKLDIDLVINALYCLANETGSEDIRLSADKLAEELTKQKELHYGSDN